MNVKTIVALLAVFCLLSCAPLSSGMKIEGTTLSCDQPRLDVHFKKEIAKIKESRNDSRIIKFKEDYRPLMIKIHKVFMKPSSVMHSMPMIASTMNHYYLGDATFGEKEWAKTSFFDEKSGCLYCGYMTNKDSDLIFVLVETRLFSKDDKDVFIEYKKTMVMAERGLAIINKQFDYFDEVAEIR